MKMSAEIATSDATQDEGKPSANYAEIIYNGIWLKESYTGPRTAVITNINTSPKITVSTGSNIFSILCNNTSTSHRKNN